MNKIHLGGIDRIVVIIGGRRNKNAKHNNLKIYFFKNISAIIYDTKILLYTHRNSNKMYFKAFIFSTTVMFTCIVLIYKS